MRQPPRQAPRRPALQVQRLARRRPRRARGSAPNRRRRGRCRLALRRVDHLQRARRPPASLAFSVIALVAALALGLAPVARAQTQEHAGDHKAAAPAKKTAAKGKKSDKAAKKKREAKSGMATGPAPKSGSMPTGRAPSGRLGTDPVPGEGRDKPPRPN